MWLKRLLLVIVIFFHAIKKASSVGVNLGKILTTRMETGHIFKEMGNFLQVKIQTYLNLSLLCLLEK